MPSKKPLPNTLMQVTPPIAEKTIKAIAAHTDRVIVTHHARERMEGRSFSDRDLFHVLLQGTATDLPVKGKKDNWECRITKKLRDRREAAVVVAIQNSDEPLVVITMMWEDGA